MLFQACIVFGYLSTLNAQSTVNQFCYGDVCYIRPDTNGRNWTDAHQRCKAFNATLPIVDNLDRQKSFEAAGRNLTDSHARDAGIWLGAKAFSSQQNWTWLDGSSYYGIDIQSQGEYIKSYVYVQNTSTGVRAFASSQNNSYSYICYYQQFTGNCTNGTHHTAFYVENRCYIKYDTVLSWFSARNACLTNDGDLASFKNISNLEGKIGSSAVWVGLRNSKWIWQNAVTGFPSDVTYTLWNDGQPDDSNPTCISTDHDGNFPYWRDRKCDEMAQSICQVVSTTVTTTEPTLNPSSITLSGTYSTVSSTAGSTGSVNIPLAVGIGVGIGAPVIILIVVVIVVVIIRRNHRNGAVNGNSQSQNKFASKNSQNNRETSEMNELENGGTRSDNNSSAQYATIRGAMGLDQDANLVLPSNHGTVYAPLSFNQANC